MNCRANNPSLADRIRVRLGFSVNLHDWKPYKKQRKDIIFTCRRCECGRNEVQQTWSRKWRSVDSKWTHEFEQEWFEEAEEAA